MKTFREKELAQEMEEIYKIVIGDEGIDTHTHGELIEILEDLVDSVKFFEDELDTIADKEREDENI